MKTFISLEKGFHRETVHCFRCGDCCNRIPPEITEEEIERIMGRLNRKEKRIFKNSLTTDPKIADPIDAVRMPLSRAAWIKAPCCFLAFEKRKGKERSFCKIYNFRPEICRIFFCGKKIVDEPLLTPKYKFELSGKFLEFMKKEILGSEGEKGLKELEIAIKKAEQRRRQQG